MISDMAEPMCMKPSEVVGGGVESDLGQKKLKFFQIEFFNWNAWVS